jgi:hypothetical protein
VYANAAFKSQVEIIVVGGRCRSGTPEPAAYEMSDRVDCWKPWAPPSKPHFRAFECANEACVKIFDQEL